MKMSAKRAAADAARAAAPWQFPPPAAAAAATIAETRAEQGARCLDGIHKGKTWLEAREIMIEMYSSHTETRSDPEKYWIRWAWRVRWDEGFAKEMETLD